MLDMILNAAEILKSVMCGKLNSLCLNGLVQKHTQGKHEGVKYPCSHCEYKTGLKSDLKTHIRHKHEGKKFSVINVFLRQDIPVIPEIMWRKSMKE